MGGMGKEKGVHCSPAHMHPSSSFASTSSMARPELVACCPRWCMDTSTGGWNNADP